MYTGDNKTAKTSQQAFVEALERLLARKSFSEISVSELSQESGISRQTFYSLFRTKENVLRYAIAHNYAYPRNVQPPADCTLARFFAHIFSRYTDANYDFLKLLVEANLTYVFYECLTEWILGHQDQMMPHIPEQQRHYFSVFVSGTVSGVINAYTQQERQDPQYLEDLLYMMFSGSALEQSPCSHKL